MANLALTFDILARDAASPTFRKVGTEAERAGSKIDNAVGSGLKKSLAVGAGALAGISIVGFFKDTIGAASDLSETVNKSNVIFGKNANEIQSWARGSAKNLGLSKGAALEAASGFGNMFTQLGFTGEAATDMSTQVVQLSADLGSFNNLPTAEVADMMSAAFRGEYDSLQRLIPNINAARVEQEAMAITGKANAKELTAQEKATAVLAIVQRDGAAAAGDFAKTSDGLANSSKIAAAQFEDLQASIGEKFLPAATGAMSFISDVAIPAMDGLFGVVSGAAEAFGDLPGPVKVGVAAFAGIALLKGPVSNAFDTIALKALYAKDSIRGVGSVMGGVKAAGSGLVGFLGGPWGIAIGAAVTGISLLASGNDDAAASEQEHKGRIEDLTEAFRESNGEITDNIRLQRIKALQQQDVISVAERAGVSERDLGDAINGNDEALRRVIDALNVYGQANKERIGSSGEAGLALTEEGKAAYGARDAIQSMAGEIDASRLALNQQKRVLGEATPTTDLFGDVVRRVGELSGETADDVKDLSDELRKLRGGTVDAAEAEINLAEQIRSAADATKELDGSVTKANGKLNLHTEAGGAAYRALVDVADASNDVIDSMRVQGRSAEQMAAKDRELRISFIKTAQQMGIGRQEAKRLADQILGVPKERRTQFDADTAEANQRIDNLQKNINNTTGKTITVQVRAAGRFIVNPNGGLQEFWKGGYTGSGGMFDVKGVVHGDEFVVPKRRVRAMGGPRAVAAAVGMGSDVGAPYMTLIHDTRAVENSMESLANAVDKATPKAGVAGSGAVGGGWQSIWSWVKARIPQARINSTYRPGDPGYHGRGKAIDFGFGSGPGGLGSAGLALINRTLHDGLGRNLAELIYDGIGDDRPDLKNGRPLNYGLGTQLEHRNHVHAAVYDAGGVLKPGLTLAYNGTGRDEYVTKGSGRTEIIVHAYTSEERRIARAIAERQRIDEVLRG